MRLARLVHVPVAAAAAVVALAVPAPAAEYAGGVVTDQLGTVAVVAEPSLDARLSGNCTYTRHAAGLQGGGMVTFTIVAEGTAVGRYRGIEIVSTGVRCLLVRPDRTITAGTDWYPGAAAVTTATADSYIASVGTVCVEVLAVLRHVPEGEPDNTISTGLQCR